MDDPRLFIALDLNDKLRASTVKLLENLQRGVQFTKAYPKWEGPESMHITLRFLGKVPESQIPAIINNVQWRMKNFKPFDYSVGRLGYFPDLRNPKVLWVGVEQGKKELVRLARAVERALIPLGYEEDIRPFQPHITLARIRAQRGIEAMMEIVRSHNKVSVGEGRVEHITLYRSDPDREGTEHTVLHKWRIKDKKEDVLAPPRTKPPKIEPPKTN